MHLDIHHILARVRHPQTNGKMERLHGEIERYLRKFEEESADRTARGPHDSHMGGSFHASPMMDAIDRFMDWYNHDRAHRSLDWENQETPAQTFSRNMPHAGETVIDQQTSDEYGVL